MANDTQYVLKLRFSVNLQEAELADTKEALEQEFVMRFLNQTELLAADSVVQETWNAAMDKFRVLASEQGMFLDNDAAGEDATQYVLKLNFTAIPQDLEDTEKPALEQNFAMRFLNQTELLGADAAVQEAWNVAMDRFRELAAEQGLFLDNDPAV